MTFIKTFKNKHILASVAVAVALGLTQTQYTNLNAKPGKEETTPVTICHADRNAKKPYGPKAITVDDDSVFKKGHDQHLGPLATSVEKAEQIKAAGEHWGDIIPPIDMNGDGDTTDPEDYPGLNYTEIGAAILLNNCQVPETEPPVVPPVIPPVTPPVTPPTTPETPFVPGRGGAGLKVSTPMVSPAEPSVQVAQPALSTPSALSLPNTNAGSDTLAMTGIGILASCVTAAGALLRKFYS